MQSRNKNKLKSGGKEGNTSSGPIEVPFPDQGNRAGSPLVRIMKYALIQSGVVVYGIGNSFDEALRGGIGILEMEKDGGDKIKCETIDDIKSLLSDNRAVGTMRVINSDDPEWNNYVWLSVK